jgi:hypothetical protein
MDQTARRTDRPSPVMLDLAATADELRAIADRLAAGAVVKGHAPATFNPTAQLGGVAWAYRRGAFLDALDRALGGSRRRSLTSTEVTTIGATWGYDGRGLGGFRTGDHPALDHVAEGRWALTDSGRQIIDDWRAFFAPEETG